MRKYREVLSEVRRPLLVLVSLVLVGTSLAPLINPGMASATTVSQRSLKIGSGVISASTSYAFSFVPATAAAIQGLKFQACTTAIGSCTAPAGLTFIGVGATGTVSGSWSNATNFTTDATGASDCIASASILCAKRTQTLSESASGVRTVTFTTITNPNGTSCATINCTFFVRMTTYNLTTYTVGSTVDTGVVASSTIQTLTINATIQETLSFCIGATTIDDSNTTTPPACSSISGTSLNLGTLSSSNTSVSPVSSGAAGGDGNNGIAELSTNASAGATVGYDAIQQSGSVHLGTLRVAGATCTAGASNTDQCIDAVGTTHSTLTAGTEKFGMTIAAVNCKATTAYTCSFTAGTYNLIRDPQYNGNGGNTYPTDTGLVSGTTNASYAWDETGTIDTIATSTTVIDREALILKFAATPNSVTPTGVYTAKADFVATPTY